MKMLKWLKRLKGYTTMLWEMAKGSKENEKQKNKRCDICLDVQWQPKEQQQLMALSGLGPSLNMDPVIDDCYDGENFFICSIELFWPDLITN